MRKRITTHNLCRCTANGEICHLGGRQLEEMVAQTQQMLASNENQRKKCRQALRAADACLRSGYPYHAISIWREAIRAVEDHEADCILHGEHNKYSSSWNRLSKEELIELARRIDKTYRQVGCPELADYEHRVSIMYEYYITEWSNGSWMDLFDNWEELYREL